MSEKLACPMEWQEEIIGSEVAMMSPSKSNHNRVKRNDVFDRVVIP